MAASLSLVLLVLSVCLQYFVHCSLYSDPNLRIKSCFKEPGGCERDKHEKNFGDGPCITGRTGGLARLDGVKVGHVEKVDVGDKKVKIITRAMRPLAFEIPNFLSGEECDYLIKLAKERNLMNSMARGGLTTKEELNVPKIQHGKGEGIIIVFNEWDVNRDGIITTDEALLFAKKYHYLILKEKDLMRLFHKVNARELDDGIITRSEFEAMNTQGIDDILYVTSLTHPKHRHRFSDQTWIHQQIMKRDPILEAIQERLIKLTGLTREIIYGSERIQIVRYTDYGHYHAHYDSETHTRTDVPCCHLITDINKLFTFKHPCRICRYMTVLYYLNDVEKGGETAFPVADNATLNRTFMENTRGEYDYYNLSENCKFSNLLIKPKKGLAFMWYNHLLDEESGWMGAMDDYGLHGGCDLHSGEKWIANSWITGSYKQDAHKKSLWLETMYPDEG